MTNRKPQLHLLDAKQLSAETLANFFSALSGREVPAGQMDELRERVEEVREKVDQQAAELSDKDGEHE
jgi:hypothetical protein